MSTFLDQVVLVDEQDRVVGTMDKVAAHRGEAKLHRAISVFLFRQGKQGPELLIQQRSQEKIVGAGQWANTCCGNVRPGETYLECAHRRLKEELGIKLPHFMDLKPVYKFQYQVKCNNEFSEQEIDQILVGSWDGEIVPNSQEVAKVEWLSWETILDSPDKASTKTLTWAPWFQIIIANPEIVAVLREYANQQ